MTTIDSIPDHFSQNEAVVEILKENPGKPLVARQLAMELFKRRPAYYQRKKHRSTQSFETDGSLIQQIVAEIGAQKSSLLKLHPNIRTTAGRPRGYIYLPEGTCEIRDLVLPSDNEALLSSDKKSPTTSAPKKTALPEAEMYPILSRYLLDEHNIRTKRIDEKRSSNRRGSGGNKWLHPDIVGIETAWAGWNANVRECAKTLANLRAKLWSFEVKISVHLGNVREVYFQAVSNSSWSNFGYLVAGQVDESVMSELRMLYAAHGVGLIVLDVENPSESEIVIPARERMDIDWVQVNRLAEENRDFMDYINLVRQFHLIGEVKNEDWDARPNSDQ